MTMKKSCMFFLLLLLVNVAEAQQKVYLTLVTHNEEGDFFCTNQNAYRANRIWVKYLVDSLTSKGVSWSFQSDWRYLTALTNPVFETAMVMSQTNNKNILKWAQEDKGLEITPHAHESVYNYADVYHLHFEAGVVPDSIAGGHLYNASQGFGSWMELKAGIFGVQFPAQFFKPDILWGAGTPGHVSDPLIHGCWHPLDTLDFLAEDSNSSLSVVGQGCRLVVDTAYSISEMMDVIRGVVETMQAGGFPSDMIISQEIFMSQSKMDSLRARHLISFIDSVNLSFVNTGLAEWKSIREIKTIWQNQFSEEPVKQACGDFMISGKWPPAGTFSVFPNPFSDQLYIDTPETVDLTLLSIEGKVLFHDHISAGTTVLSLGFLAKGIYIFRVQNRNSVESIKVLRD